MYRLYVDEVGHNQVKNFKKDCQIYLSLTGVAMNVSHARDVLEPNMNWIKAKVFSHDPDSPMVFHRKDIRGFKGLYEALRDEQKSNLYNRLFSKFLKRLNIRLSRPLSISRGC